MNRGEIWFAEAGRKRRPVLVLTRTEVIEVRALVTVAEVTTSVRGIGAEVELDGEDTDVAELVEAEQVYPASTSYLTTISILVPVYDPPVKFLRECLESVVGQQARNWQLVVVNDGSTKPDVAEFLAGFATMHEGDGRIVITAAKRFGAQMSKGTSAAGSR
mgnify:CR=1 FL=1